METLRVKTNGEAGKKEMTDEKIWISRFLKKKSRLKKNRLRTEYLYILSLRIRFKGKTCHKFYAHFCMLYVKCCLFLDSLCFIL